MQGLRQDMDVDALGAGVEDLDASAIADLLQIQQIQCTFQLGMRVEPGDLAYLMPRTKYSYKNRKTSDRKPPDRFNRVFYEAKNPTAIFAIYASGRVLLLNGESEALAKIACKRLVRFLRAIEDYKLAKFLNFKINTMSAIVPEKYWFPLRINTLEALLKADKGLPQCFYDSDSTNLCVIVQKMPFIRNSVRVLMFNAGGVRVLGGKSMAELKEAFKRVYPYVVAAKINTPRVLKPNGKRVHWKDMSLVGVSGARAAAAAAAPPPAEKDAAIEIVADAAVA